MSAGPTDEKPIVVPDTAKCLDCGYLLRGLPRPVCPECGRDFDPRDADTYFDPAKRKPLLERLFPYRPPKPPSTFYAILLVWLAIIVLVGTWSLTSFFAWPWDIETAGCLVSLPVLVALIDYLRRRSNLNGVRARANPKELEEFHHHRTQWRVATACIAIIAVASLRPPLPCLRFYLSWPALSRAADEFLAHKRTDTGSQWIGLVHVEQIWGHGRGFVFFQTGHDSDGDDHRCGFVYRPRSRAWRHASRWIAPSWYLERR